MENFLVSHSTRLPTRSSSLAYLPSSVCAQTLKDYQRRLDTSGLKPSNELYTEYKVRGHVLGARNTTWRLEPCMRVHV